MNILYIVHDLNDAAVQRRIAMLESGGAAVTVMGFYRGNHSPLCNQKVISLGQTRDASFLHRALSVLKAKVRLSRILQQHGLVRGHFDCIIARNLDTLSLAVTARSKLSLPLIYECLDIHRFLIHSGTIGHLFRALEKRLTRHVVLLVTSSQGFIDHYFKPISQTDLSTLVVENKVFATQSLPMAKQQIPFDPNAIVITWNGAIRCARSMKILSIASRAMQGRLHIIIHGKPAYSEFDDFDSMVKNEPFMEFLGAYQFPQDLAKIYNNAHFNWTLDFFEQGGNSEWLLPNRIYEGGLFATPPLYRQDTYTGKTLAELGIGIGLSSQEDEKIAGELVEYLKLLNPAQYQTLYKGGLDLPRSLWLFDQPQAKKLVQTLAFSCQEASSLKLNKVSKC